MHAMFLKYWPENEPFNEVTIVRIVIKKNKK